jgi:hypothetical protein
VAEQRHGGRIEGVAIVEAEAPRAWLGRNRLGLRFNVRDVLPGRFGRVVTFAELAAVTNPAS